MLSGFVGRHADDILSARHPAGATTPVAQVMQHHQTNSDADEPHVEHSKESRPTRFDSRGGFLDRRGGQNLRNPRVGIAARFLQIIRVDGGPGICMRENTVHAMT